MDSSPKLGKKLSQKIFRTLYKITIIILCCVLFNYVNIGLIDKIYNEPEKIVVAQNNNEEGYSDRRNFQPTSRGAVKRMPKVDTYTIYKLTIKDKEFLFEDVSEAEKYKVKIETETNNIIKGEITPIYVCYIENLTTAEEIETFINDKVIDYKKSLTYYPTVSTYISSYYGARKSPTTGASSFHKGIDIAGKSGDNIFAYKSGKVISSGYNSGGYGNMILIQHEDGMMTRYGHLKSIYVNTGDYVTGGQIIGAMGSTGISTGNHLHFEIIIDNVNINPYNYIF